MCILIYLYELEVGDVKVGPKISDKVYKKSNWDFKYLFLSIKYEPVSLINIITIISSIGCKWLKWY